MSAKAGQIPEPNVPPNGKGAAHEKRVDRASKVIIYQGASVGQLGLLFGMDNRTIARKIAALTPKANRGGHPIYSIREAAPFLVRPAGDIEEHLKRMNPRDLPPMLQKEFWTGQSAKLAFEEATGQLWRTDSVIEHVGEVFKILRTELVLMSDAVEREIQLPTRAREILKALIDGAMAGMRDRLLGRFAEQIQAQEDEAELEAEIDFYFDDLTVDEEFFNDVQDQDEEL